MVDYYALPKNWPGREEAINLEFSRKASHIEVKIHKEIQSIMGGSWNPNYFIPFIIIHEFESLLFSDCEQLAVSLGQTELVKKFQKIRDQYHSPEEINDSPQTHPSQRIQSIVPTYQKPLNGSQAAERIGIDVMQRECLHFRAWLTKLKAIALDSDPSFVR